MEKHLGHFFQNKAEYQRLFQASWLDTPLGTLLAIADGAGLYLLDFSDKNQLEQPVKRLQDKTKAAILIGSNPVLDALQKELGAYFAGTLKVFRTPSHLLGTPFQQRTWSALCQIPHGTTRSYAEQAEMIGQKTAHRAVANANGANPIIIVIPCHRIINSNGDLGGYRGGLDRKKWLIEHEKSIRA